MTSYTFLYSINAILSLSVSMYLISYSSQPRFFKAKNFMCPDIVLFGLIIAVSTD